MVQKRDMELDIVELLIRKENHVRGIARILNESHSTVSRKLSKLKEGNVIDSRKEGRNKIFYLKQNLVAKNYILQAEMHKLEKLFHRYPELSVIFEEILRKTDERLIVLFGSYAKGLAKKDSDIDIYIETGDIDIKKAIEDVHSRINVKTGEFDARSPLIREIIKDHVIVRGVEEFYEKQVSE